MKTIKTSFGKPIEFVKLVEVEDLKGFKFFVKAGLVIATKEKDRGVGLEGFSFEKTIFEKEKKYCYRNNNTKVFISEEEMKKILNDPKYKNLKKIFYGN